MALYVHPENQELLWNIMNQNQYLNTMLSYQSIEQKQEWFKNIIQLFYQQNSHKTLDKTQLNQLNKDTLSYMMNYAKAVPPPNNIESSYLSQKNQRTVDTFQNKISTPPIIPDNRADIFNQQFNARQKEYETMLDKKPPAEPDFKEPVNDSAISNMDELIKKHMEERDAELRKYSPPPPLPTIQTEQAVSPPTTEKKTENIILEQETPVLELSEKITILLNEMEALHKKVDILLQRKTHQIRQFPIITPSGESITNNEHEL
uniref:Uncharacterized protein n=1 Tax=viral metagenome TaxID=1070528 RepID=A0A6C0D3Z1_9ZZZZ